MLRITANSKTLTDSFSNRTFAGDGAASYLHPFLYVVVQKIKLCIPLC